MYMYIYIYIYIYVYMYIHMYIIVGHGTSGVGRRAPSGTGGARAVLDYVLPNHNINNSVRD